MPGDPSSVRGVGGWLLVFVIGAGVLSPLFFLFSAMTTYYPLFAEGAWQTLTTPASPSYYPLWKPIILLEIIGGFVVVVFGIYAAVQLFAERPRAPALAIAFLVANLLLAVVDRVLVSWIPAASARANSADLIQAAVAAAVWIPYFKFSKRVKGTYDLSPNRLKVSVS